MPLRLTARVITQLGAELISSDAVALFELVKNGFDAGSPSVSIDITYAADYEALTGIEEELARRFKSEPFNGERAAEEIGERLRRKTSKEQSALLREDAASKLEVSLRKCRSLSEAQRVLRSVNSIEVSDAGCGMTAEEVDEYFLTVGTTHRQRQHQAHIERGEPYPNDVPLAGEKGIGRFSTMRLGRYLVLKTWTKGKNYQTGLEVDWRWFYDNPEADPSAYQLIAHKESRTAPTRESGTRLIISDLTSGWPRSKVLLLASHHLAKFVDPFSDESRKIKLRWNTLSVDVVGLIRAYLDAAPNGMKGKITIDKKGAFKVTVDFWFTRPGPLKEKFEFTRTLDVHHFGGLTNEEVAAVGPFSFELYHYNRRHLEAIPEVASREEVRKWLNEWAGGLMVYRDNLRVLPYGSHPEDDWLELDQRALRGKGFRVNRIQVLGCVRISRVDNPELRDQTNREGLQENEASRTLHELMRRLIAENFVPLYREKVEESAPLDPGQLASAAEEAEEEVTQALERFLAAVRSGNETAILSRREELQAAVNHINELAAAIEEAAVTHQLQRIEVTELASKGLAAEAMAHDIEAVLDSSISEAGVLVRQSRFEERLRQSLQHLIAVLKAARVQIAGIRPGPTRRRRRRSRFDLCQMIREVAGLFETRFDRHNIRFNFTVRPRDGELVITAVEGHVRQILENLLRNSIYWALDARKKDPDATAEIEMRCDAAKATVTIRDSGPGFAPEETDWVFVAFNTHRPRGHGLGLTIARDLAEFNRITIQVDVREKNALHRYPGLLLDFRGCVHSDD